MEELKDNIPQTKNKIHVPLWMNNKKNGEINKDLLNILKSVPFFARLSKHELKQISLILYERKYSASEYLFKEDTPALGMFIIKSGTIEIEKINPAGESMTLASIGQGEILGELALLTDIQRTASALCVTPATAYILFKHDLNDLISRETGMGVKIMQDIAALVSDKLKQTTDELVKYKMETYI